MSNGTKSSQGHGREYSNPSDFADGLITGNFDIPVVLGGLVRKNTTKDVLSFCLGEAEFGYFIDLPIELIDKIAYYGVVLSEGSELHAVRLHLVANLGKVSGEKLSRHAIFMKDLIKAQFLYNRYITSKLMSHAKVSTNQSSKCECSCNNASGSATSDGCKMNLAACTYANQACYCPGPNGWYCTFNSVCGHFFPLDTD